MGGVDKEVMTMWRMRHLKRKGVADPNVDLFVAVADNDLAAARAALEAGADPNVRDRKVIDAHRLDLADFDPKDWQ